jgi:general secretion pathway protein G
MEKQLTKRIRRLSKKRGVTLVEVLIVLAIMALISGSAVFLVFPALAKAKLDTAKLSAGVVKQAAQMYIEIDGSDGCPTVDDLVNSRKLEKGKTADPWGTPFKIDCKEDLRVISAGKDKKEGTPDDVRDNSTKAELDAIAKGP